VTQAGRLGSAWEDMTQMRVAPRAFDFRSQHARAEIFFHASQQAVRCRRGRAKISPRRVISFIAAIR